RSLHTLRGGEGFRKRWKTIWTRGIQKIRRVILGSLQPPRQIERCPLRKLILALLPGQPRSSKSETRSKMPPRIESCRVSKPSSGLPLKLAKPAVTNQSRLATQRGSPHRPPAPTSHA